MLPARALVKPLRELITVTALILGAVPTPQIIAIGSSPRTVVIVDPQRPSVSSVVQTRLCAASPQCENGKDGIDVVQLLSGTLPTAPVIATVVVDANCDPDRYGISHCLNVLRLRNGSTVVVRHDHKMSRYPCLTPGETVRVTTASNLL
jgi:hypothetical protein